MAGLAIAEQRIKSLAQSGVIPYRSVGASLEVLLITTRSGQRLIVPKGSVERGMSPVESAQKEAFEEAGVSGKPHADAIGMMFSEREGRPCAIQLWPMRVSVMHARWPEMSFRRRIWLPVPGAAMLVEREDLAELIVRLGERLAATRAAA